MLLHIMGWSMLFKSPEKKEILTSMMGNLALVYASQNHIVE